MLADTKSLKSFSSSSFSIVRFRTSLMLRKEAGLRIRYRSLPSSSPTMLAETLAFAKYPNVNIRPLSTDILYPPPPAGVNGRVERPLRRGSSLAAGIQLAFQ